MRSRGFGERLVFPYVGSLRLEYMFCNAVDAVVAVAAADAHHAGCALSKRHPDLGRRRVPLPKDTDRDTACSTTTRLAVCPESTRTALASSRTLHAPETSFGLGDLTRCATATF